MKKLIFSMNKLLIISMISPALLASHPEVTTDVINRLILENNKQLQKLVKRNREQFVAFHVKLNEIKNNQQMCRNIKDFQHKTVSNSTR